MKIRRMVIYPKDVQIITGRTLRYAQRLLGIIKKSLGKQQNHLVTRDEFCEFTGLRRDELDAHLEE